MPGSVPIEVRGIGDNVLVAGVAGKRVRVWGYLLVPDFNDRNMGKATVRWRSGLQGGGYSDLSGPLPLNDVIAAPPGQSPYFETDVGADLVLNCTETVLVAGHAYTTLIG